MRSKFLNITPEQLDILKRDMKSRNRDIQYTAKIYYYSFFKYKSIAEFSRAVGIPYINCFMTIKRYYKKLIKKAP